MRTEQSYPAPVHGISTLAPRTRPQGYATKQVNFRSDPVNKLTRRPPSLWKEYVATVSDTTQIQYHSYYRDGKEYSFIIDKVTGSVYCAIDDVVVDTLSLGTYNGSNLGLYTIEHDTYILNKDKVVAALPDTDVDDIEKVSHINITSALNYGETITVKIIQSNGTKSSTSYTIPDLGTTEPDYDTADKARATAQVALALASQINGGPQSYSYPNPDFPPTPTGSTEFIKYCNQYISSGANPDYDATNPICKPFIVDSGIAGLNAIALGSTVAVWEDGRAEWCQVEIESGQGDRTSVAINQIVESTDGLPLYAVVGTRITVRPDPTSEKGLYYLQAERVADIASGEVLEEVVWSEDRNPEQPHSFDNTTMPHRIEYDGTNFTFGPVVYDSRKTGDDESTPFPDFLGEQLTTMGYFQKRLVVVSGNAVYMSETEDLENWFRQSAVNLLVSDPIGVTTSELGTDKILYLVPHNRDLLCITSNSQFKINGSEALTPQTVSMPLTTKYECQVSVEPVTMGNSVYFPIDYGDSTGVQEYTGQKNTSQDFAKSVTNHVIGLLKGEARLMASSPNLEMIAMTTSESPDNTLFIYEQYTESNGKRSQQAWSTWEFTDNEKIVDTKFRRNELIILVAKNNKLFIKSIPMYTRVTASPLDVFLDDMLIETTNGLTVDVPTDYDTDSCVVIRGSGTNDELWKVGYTRTGDTLTFEEDIGAGQVYIGRTYRSEYEPTRPFKYDEDGSTITTDKIRVSRWVLSLVNTHELAMTKKSKYGADNTVEFEARFVGEYELGSVVAYTGDWKFSFAEDAGLATATFYVDNHLGCTVSDFSWEGQYFQSKQRMK